MIASVQARRELRRKRIVKQWEAVSEIVEEFLGNGRSHAVAQWQGLLVACRTVDAERKKVDNIFAHYEPEDLEVRLVREAGKRGIQLPP